jgi:hypothetical protein
MHALPPVLSNALSPSHFAVSAAAASAAAAGQTSCSWVLKESRAVYKAASEGVMNLADKFFEMERAQALQVGLSVLLFASVCVCALVF